MGTALEIESVNGVIDAQFQGDLSTAARKQEFIADAKDMLAQAEQQDAAIFGHVPAHITLVDGVQTDNLDQVRSNGTVTFEFQGVGLGSVFEWIADMLLQNSPVGDAGDDVHPGLYRRSHLWFADGIEFDPTGLNVPQAQEYIAVNAQPYARKIEQGESPQDPDGVYEGVAVLAQQQFPEFKIRFAYRDPQAIGVNLGRYYAHKTARTIRHSALRSSLADLQAGEKQPAIVITTQ